MLIFISDEGTVHQQIKIKDIEGDMGEDTRIQLLQQSDGDVIVTLYNTKEGIMDSIEFCTSNGGGKNPIIAKKLREVIAELCNSKGVK